MSARPEPLFTDPPRCRACKATHERDCRWASDNRDVPTSMRDRRPKTCLTPRYDPATARIPF